MNEESRALRWALEHLEPEAVREAGTYNTVVIEMSKAISLKRIADALQAPLNGLNIRDLLSEIALNTQGGPRG